MKTRDDCIVLELIKCGDKIDISNFRSYQKEYHNCFIDLTFNFQRKCRQYSTLHQGKRAQIRRQNNIIEITNGFLTKLFYLELLPLMKTNSSNQLKESQMILLL